VPPVTYKKSLFAAPWVKTAIDPTVPAVVTVTVTVCGELVAPTAVVARERGGAWMELQSSRNC